MMFYSSQTELRLFASKINQLIILASKLMPTVRVLWELLLAIFGLAGFSYPLLGRHCSYGKVLNEV